MKRIFLPTFFIMNLCISTNAQDTFYKQYEFALDNDDEDIRYLYTIDDTLRMISIRTVSTVGINFSLIDTNGEVISNTYHDDIYFFQEAIVYDPEKEQFIFDGVELADGGFMVVGGLTEAPGEATKILISRLDEEGCLIDDCPWVYHMGDLLNGVVHTEEEKGIDIYPNPTSGMVHVECTAKIRHISVMDIAGKLISRYFIDRSNTNIDLGAFEDGVYIFQIVDEGGKVETRKVIKL